MILTVAVYKNLTSFWLQVVPFTAENDAAVALILTLVLNAETLEFLLEPFLYIFRLFAFFLA